MHYSRFRAGLGSVVVFATLALAACSESSQPTEPTRLLGPSEMLSPTRKAPVISVDTLALTSNALTVGGANVDLTTNVVNDGVPVIGVSVTCTISQKKVARAACNPLVDFGGDPGVLATGSRAITIPVIATNTTDGQGTLSAGPATLTISVVSAAGVLAKQSVGVALVPVSFFANSLLTGFRPGDATAEGSNMIAAVQSLGYDVSQFSTMDDATWAQAAQSNVIVIPQLSHDLFAAMSPAQRQSVVDLVGRGGTLVTVAQNVDFVNQLFGLALVTETELSSNLSVDARGTSFEAGPLSLPANVGSLGIVPISVPLHNLGIYLGFTVPNPTSTDFAIHVAVLRPVTFASQSKGQIIVLGWNWFDGRPVGSQDGGWNDVLNRAIRFGPAGF
jgi:hypothetical protein